MLRKLPPGGYGSVGRLDSTTAARGGRARFRPTVTRLEDRMVPATFHVTSGLDNGALEGTLRFAVNRAADGDVIHIAAPPSRIVLTSELRIGVSVTVVATGGRVAISGNNADRVFEITNPAANVTLVNLLIQGGNPSSGGDGGGVLNVGGLTIRDTILASNFAAGSGGAIYNSGRLNVVNSVIQGNTAINGGGIMNSGGVVSITGSTIRNNSASGDGGGVNNDGGVLNVGGFPDGAIGLSPASTFSGNSASGRGGAIFNAFDSVGVGSNFDSYSAPNTVFTGNTAGSGLTLGGTQNSFVITGPASTPESLSHEITLTVTAMRPSGTVDTDYAGTVRFADTLSSRLPPATTFTPADKGVKTFTIELDGGGVHRFRVSDVSDPRTFGRFQFNDLATATDFRVSALPDPLNPLVAYITVVAYRNGAIEDEYHHTVRISKTESPIGLPEFYTFREDERGRHTFTVLRRPGTSMSVEFEDSVVTTTAGSVELNDRNLQKALDELFVERVDAFLLGDAASARAFTAEGGSLARAATRTALAFRIEKTVASEAFRIQGMYQRFLARSASPAEVNKGLRRLRAGGSLTGVETEILGSHEYLLKRGSGTRSGLLSALNADVFRGRLPAVTLAGARLSLTRGVSQRTLVARLLHSNEFRRRELDDIVHDLLDRHATAQEYERFSSRLRTQRGTDRVVASILGSTEFLSVLVQSHIRPTPAGGHHDAE